MKRTISSLLLGVILPLGAAVAVTAPATDAHAQRYYYHGGYAPPSPAWYANRRPIYYNGYAHYYYNNHWYYRDRYGAWQYYERPPQYFCTYRDEYYGWHGC